MTTATKESLRTVKGRPQLFTSYAREMAIFYTRVKRNWVIAGIIAFSCSARSRRSGGAGLR